MRWRWKLNNFVIYFYKLTLQYLMQNSKFLPFRNSTLWPLFSGTAKWSHNFTHWYGQRPHSKIKNSRIFHNPPPIIKVISPKFGKSKCLWCVNFIDLCHLLMEQPIYYMNLVSKSATFLLVFIYKHVKGNKSWCKLLLWQNKKQVWNLTLE